MAGAAAGLWPEFRFPPVNLWVMPPVACATATGRRRAARTAAARTTIAATAAMARLLAARGGCEWR